MHAGTRRLLVFCATMAASCIAAAADSASPSRACDAFERPSKLDYMVLASMADSSHLVSMAGYRTTAQRAEPRAGDASDLAEEDQFQATASTP